VGKGDVAGRGPEGLREPPTSPDEIRELINRRRRQVAIHSFLYYRLNDSIIPDHVFDKWSVELVDLQTRYPALSEEVPFHLDYFRGWDGSSGFDIPFDPYIQAKAEQIRRIHEQRAGLGYGYS